MIAKIDKEECLWLESETKEEGFALENWYNNNREAMKPVRLGVNYMSKDLPESTIKPIDEQTIEQRKFCIELAAKCNHGMNPDGVAGQAERYLRFIQNGF